MNKQDIRGLNVSKMEEFFISKGEKRFRAKQVYEWLWKKSAVSFSEMTNLSKETRSLLEESFEIRNIITEKTQVSSDGTIKMAFKLFDGHLIEGVLIPTDNRMTACISSQVGCSLSCKFCATGYMDRMRNLEPGEIYDQVVAIGRVAMQAYQIPLSNIVFMGMGEPLLNYKNVMESIDLITSDKGLGMASKRITVSTAGIAKMIKKLAEDSVKFNLALSLHAANDQKRNEIMPINEANNLEVLKGALSYFYEATRNPVTFEYIVFNNFNDTLDDARELLKIARQIPCKVNIIEYNPIDYASYKNADQDAIAVFANFLLKNGVNVNVRRSRGKDIDAACGQLANKN
ncbi:MAG TPA: 23S rRNA (adenine(2503)-C(2))-methyltransferase RlmN [Cyclobacteriaceae bacterium]